MLAQQLALVELDVRGLCAQGDAGAAAPLLAAGVCTLGKHGA